MAILKTLRVINPVGTDALREDAFGLITTHSAILPLPTVSIHSV